MDKTFINQAAISMQPRQFVGQRFGRLIVIRPQAKGTKLKWLCRCDCGETTLASKFHLCNGKHQSCGCLKMERTIEMGRSRLIDLAGDSYSWLTVIGRSNKKNKAGATYWECVCDCGKTVYASSQLLRSGQTRHCGCKKEKKRNDGKRNSLSVKDRNRDYKKAIERVAKRRLPKPFYLTTIVIKNVHTDRDLLQKKIRSIRAIKNSPFKDSIMVRCFVTTGERKVTILRFLTLGATGGRRYFSKKAIADLLVKYFEPNGWSFVVSRKTLKTRDQDAILNTLVQRPNKDKTRIVSYKHSRSGFFL